MAVVLMIHCAHITYSKRQHNTVIFDKKMIVVDHNTSLSLSVHGPKTEVRKDAWTLFYVTHETLFCIVLDHSLVGQIFDEW